MAKAFVVLVVWVLMALSADAAGVREGMTRAEVEAELGKPVSVLERPGATVLRYPNDGRVELVNGKVVRAVRVRHVDDPASPEELAVQEAARVAAEVAAEEAKLAKRETEALALAAKEEAAAEAAWAKAESEAQRKMEATVERLTAEHEAGAGAAAAELGLHEEPSEFWALLGVGALVQVGVGMVILKLAFRWADVHADWSQMLWPALAGMAGGAAVRGAAYAGWGMSECFRLDDAVSYGAMFFALLKTTHACTWQRAVGVAAAAKLMSIIVWVFLSVAISQAMFG